MQCTTVASDPVLQLAEVCLPSIEADYKLVLHPGAFMAADPRETLARFRHVMDMLESYAVQKAESPMRVLFESGMQGEALAAMQPRLAELLAIEFPYYVKDLQPVEDVAGEIEKATKLRIRRVGPGGA